MRQAVQDAAQATNKYDVEFEIFNYADEAALGRPRATTTRRVGETAAEREDRIYRQNQQDFVESVEQRYAKDVGARQADAAAREVAEEGADVGDETYIAIQQGKEARAASRGKTREEQIYLANQRRSFDSIGHTLAGGVSLSDLPPIEESLSG